MMFKPGGIDRRERNLTPLRLEFGPRLPENLAGLGARVLGP
jgi:hypothetical protein